MPKHQNPYHFINTFCFRTPIFSLSFYENLINKPFFELNDLYHLWNSKTVKEAIFLASPDLYSQIEKLTLNKDLKIFDKIKIPLLKYLIRASTRCTPFGLFSGVGTGKIDNSSELILLPFDKHKRKTLFDTHFISNLALQISRDSSIQKKLPHYPNTSLYKIANQYRYVEYKIYNDVRSYSLEAVEANMYLDKIILECQNGKKISELVNCLIEQEISKEEANDYIKALIDNQVLVSELELNITGNDVLNELISTLERYDDKNLIIKKLSLLKESINELDSNIGNDIKLYNDIVKNIKEINIPFNYKYLFQTDLYIQSCKSTLQIKNAYKIKKIIPFLLKLNPYTENENLKRFKRSFNERYQEQEIPMAIALDIETGLGYVQNNTISDTTPFLNDITPDKSQYINKTQNYSLNNVETIIYKKLIQSQKNNQYNLELLDSDFENIDSKLNYLPDTLSAFFELAIINNQEQIILKALGNNAGKLLGRFCNGNQKINQNLNEIIEIEERLNPNKILAEIVHLPESRTGNILKRPHIRKYEIPYMAKSTKLKTEKLPINDLYVSVKDNKIVLKSRRLNKEVIPKLTNAHNHSVKALPIYHFLCDLESQNKRNYLGFYWPEITREFVFLPRVTYKGIIVSKAKWNIFEVTIKDFISCKNDKQLLQKISLWRKQYKVPEYVQLVENDNTLLICMNHIESIKLFVRSIKSKKSILLEEFLFITNNIISKTTSHFSNEYLITFYNQQKLKQNDYQA